MSRNSKKPSSYGWEECDVQVDDDGIDVVDQLEGVAVVHTHSVVVEGLVEGEDEWNMVPAVDLEVDD